MPLRRRRESQPKPEPVTPIGDRRTLTTDRDDPRLGHGVDTERIPQHEAYLVLSDEERAKGFVRPVRRSYMHVGAPGPVHPLRDLTEEEQGRYDKFDYIKYEEYPEGSKERENAIGSYWTQARLDNIGKGCGTVTSMNQVIAETYARDPNFYGATYCCGCQQHLQVGRQGEFVWVEPDGRTTTLRVGE